MRTDHALPDLPPEPIEIPAGPIQLRPWEHRLAPELLTALRDPEYRQWGPGPAPAMPELPDAHAWIERRLSHWAQRIGCAFAVQESTTGALLGGVGFHGFSEWTDSARLGFWTMPSARGSGIATRAVRSITRWGFGGLGLHRIGLNHALSNTASCAVAERCGYAVEGVAREAMLAAGGGWYDMEVHARLATDPAPAP